MINFRYHIVSLMAVFLALSVGIAVGVSLRPSVAQGLNQQAAQDRRQVQELRTELARRNALDKYANEWAAQAGAIVAAGVLNGERVALVGMPDAPTAVLDAVSTAVREAGGTVTRTAKINASAFDPAQAGEMDAALNQYAGQLNLSDDTAQPTQLGLALGRALLSKQPGEEDDLGVSVRKSLTGAGLASISGRSTAQAQLAIVVTTPAPDPRPTKEQVDAHVQFDVALKEYAAGVVIAGPNSDGIDGTDVLGVRADGDAADTLSTVDVADLSSGVTTVVLAGAEQLRGRQGHYGALADADAPAPELPVR